MLKLCGQIALALVVAGPVSGCASTQEEAGHIGFAAMTPMRDLNIGTVPIPQPLTQLYHPYGQAGSVSCDSLRRELLALQYAISENEGRRVGFRRDSSTFEGRTGNLRDVGVAAAVTAPIPLRGLVRQVSGAAQLEQQAQQASDRARLRVGYIVGTARAAGCPGFQPERRPGITPAVRPPAASVPRGTVPRR